MTIDTPEHERALTMVANATLAERAATQATEASSAVAVTSSRPTRNAAGEILKSGDLFSETAAATRRALHAQRAKGWQRSLAILSMEVALEMKLLVWREAEHYSQLVHELRVLPSLNAVCQVPNFRASMGAFEEDLPKAEEGVASLLTSRVKKSQGDKRSSSSKKKKKSHKSRSKALASQMDIENGKQDASKAAPPKNLRDKLNGMVHGSKGHFSRMALSLDDHDRGMEINAETKIEFLDDDDDEVDDNNEAPGAQFLGRMAARSDAQAKKRVPLPRPQARPRMKPKSSPDSDGQLPRPLPVVRSPDRYKKAPKRSNANSSLRDASDSDDLDAESAHAKDSSVAVLDDLEALAAQKAPDQQDSPAAGKRRVASPRPKSPVKPLPRPTAAVRGRTANGKQNVPTSPASSSSSSSESDSDSSDDGAEECVAVLNDLEAMAEKVPEQPRKEIKATAVAGKKPHANTSRPRSPVKPLPRARAHSPVPRPNRRPPSAGDGDGGLDDGPRHTTL